MNARIQAHAAGRQGLCLSFSAHHRKAYGFRTPQGIEFALFHVMGNLPEPQFTHRFC
jgi:transposase